MSEKNIEKNEWVFRLYEILMFQFDFKSLILLNIDKCTSDKRIVTRALSVYSEILKISHKYNRFFHYYLPHNPRL